MGRDELDLRTYMTAFDLDTVKLLMTIFVSKTALAMRERTEFASRILIGVERLASTRFVSLWVCSELCCLSVDSLQAFGSTSRYPCAHLQ